MKFLKVLKNNNQIASETVKNAFYPENVGSFSMKMVFNGNTNYTIGRRQLNLYPDSFLTINQGTTYSSKVDSWQPVNNLSISFSPLFLADFCRAHKNIHQSLLDDPYKNEDISRDFFLETIYPFSGDMKYNILHLKHQIEMETTDDLLINEYLYHCLLNYYKVYHKEVLGKSEKLNFLNNSTKIEILKRLTFAREFINSNYNKCIDLEDIAKSACLSVNHLLRTFKQAYGISPHQYLIQVRIERAKYFLKNTSYTLNEIVELIGFECPSSFIRLFRTMNKTTPGKYRACV
ncbi:MAG: AraC family transcriptional regulator [Pedobacter sp.]|jgi:AraC-like DNA-binding protein